MSTPHITADEVLRPGSPYANCELWDGRAIECEPSGGEAESVAANVVIALGTFVQKHWLGRVFLGSQGFLVARDPDRLLSPDGAFVSRQRLPRVPSRGFIELAPDFLIEVRSPDDTWEHVIEKCSIWQSHGTRCVWAIDPLQQRLAELRPAKPIVVHQRRDAVARAAPVLEGFSMTLAAVFDGI